MRKRPKLTLIFDEEKRKEYLTGFRKRKLERKEKGRLAAEKQLKEEIKAVKAKYREAARQKLEGIHLPGMLDCTESVRSCQSEIIGGHNVVIQELDISNCHYFMGAAGEEQKSEPIDCVAEPKMSLKKALKMNPMRSKKRFRRAKKKPCAKNKRRR